MFEATNLTLCLKYLLHFPMKVFVKLVYKENAPKAPNTGARRGSKPLPRDPVQSLTISSRDKGFGVRWVFFVFLLVHCTTLGLKSFEILSYFL